MVLLSRQCLATSDFPGNYPPCYPGRLEGWRWPLGITYIAFVKRRELVDASIWVDVTDKQ
jgi:hypothetical protein